MTQKNIFYMTLIAVLVGVLALTACGRRNRPSSPTDAIYPASYVVQGIGISS